ncbi:transmembrane protein 91-like [Anolis sagrei]|uniref:transmembrane protein 91-like n=1 Tax=Anolis sagrei TaxID=38937 RepID=UPI0035221CAA
MSNHNYEEMKGTASVTDHPSSHSEKHFHQESDSLKLPLRPPPPMSYGAPPPPTPPSYQSSCGPPDPQLSQGPEFQSQQAIFITPVQPTKEPDNVVYSIFTLMCCFLPLGIVALIYALKTQEANHDGNATVAQKYSRLSRIMAHIAFGFGLLIWTLYITKLTIISRKHDETRDQDLANLSTNNP